MSDGDWITPKPAQPLSGNETLNGLDRKVLDFWRWAFSDLRTNIVRGVFAEYLVAQAVGDPSPLRQAWDDFDVTSRSGARVEVKSSGYLQSWRQQRLSQITFSGLTGRSWSAETNLFADDRTLRADVFVFAIHTCRDPDQYDPIDVASWEFRVLPASVLRGHGYRSVTLAFLIRAGTAACGLADLAEAVERAAELERQAR